jgi:hypothetical protein
LRATAAHQLRISRAAPADFDLRITKLRPEVLDLTAKSGRLRLGLPAAQQSYVAFHLGLQQLLEAALPQKKVRCRAFTNAGSGLAKRIEQRAGTRALARFESGSRETGGRIGAMQRHEDVDIRRVELALRRDVGRAELMTE